MDLTNMLAVVISTVISLLAFYYAIKQDSKKKHEDFVVWKNTVDNRLNSIDNKLIVIEEDNEENNHHHNSIIEENTLMNNKLIEISAYINSINEIKKSLKYIENTLATNSKQEALHTARINNIEEKITEMKQDIKEISNRKRI